MSKGKGAFKVLRNVLITVAAVLIAAVVAIFLIVRFYIIPEYNKHAAMGENPRQELKTGDLVEFAKYLTDRQFVENLKNFDKGAAKEVLNVLNELEEEAAAEATPTPKPTQTPAPTPVPTPVPVWDESLTQTLDNILPTPTPEPTATPEPTEEPITEIPEGVSVSKKEKGAYERIMMAADAKEISTGMAIIAKVDLAKVKQLYYAKKTAELKKYIKSVLTSQEISTSLALYNKYKHLL